MSRVSILLVTPRETIQVTAQFKEHHGFKCELLGIMGMSQPMALYGSMRQLHPRVIGHGWQLLIRHKRNYHTYGL